MMGSPQPKKRFFPQTRGTYPTLGGDVRVPDAEGRLRVVRLGDDGTSEGRHRTDFVPGPDYGGMEDNDIRGLLDGTFLYGWNQVGQKYVRAGRIDNVFKYGEYELFRILQRWDGLSLPEGAEVDDVALNLVARLEDLTSVRSLFLYAVRHDWEPGRGGVDGNNASPPNPGSVWWNERRFGEEQWGMPGASSADDLEANPLARFALEPGNEAVVFRSEALTRYVRRRMEAGDPLLFLIKLQDHQEDVPGSMIYLWSATEGDDRGEGRKPRLTLWWRARETVLVDEPLMMEHGRSRVVPCVGADVVEVVPAEGSGPVDVAARPRDGTWRRVVHGRLDPDDVEVRVRALSAPVVLGDTLTLSLRDTWVTTAPPEEQKVSCTFVSPSGRAVRVGASYPGAFTWVVELVPDEVGRWRYQWRHQLQSSPDLPREEAFDVVVESLDGAATALEDFLGLVSATEFRSREELARMMVRFSKLERVALAHMTAEEFRGPEGEPVRALIRRIRAAFGSPVPDEIPLVGVDPPPWETT